MTMHLGTVLPGTTLYVPFHTFDSNDPSASVTITGLAATDIEIYKDGSVTQRASDTGYALLDTDGIDFDGITGIHGFSVDLASNATAGFFEAGSSYWVVVSAVTVDAATVNFVAATFRIGYPGAILDTTIATLASQTSFTLEDGSADNDAYNGCVCIIHDLASAVQVAQGVVADYTGSTKTVTLAFDPAVFTMAAGDSISFFPRVSAHAWNGVPLATTNPLPNAAADAAGGLVISDAGGLDADAMAASVSAIETDTSTTLDNLVDDLESRLGTPSDLGSGATIAANLVDIEAQTDDIGAAGAGLTEAGGTGDHLTALATQASVDALNDLSAADVNAEVVDALATDTYAEPTGVPAATATLAAKIGTLHMMARNKVTVTATKKTFFDDGDAAEFEKDLSDDDTTYTESEANAI
jgi:plastocyanin